MATASERVRHVSLKIERAKAHAAALRSAVAGFMGASPYVVSTKRDSVTRKLIYFVESAQPTPDDLLLIAGDAIQNLATALDHLAYQLVCKDTSDAPPKPDRIYFPISGSQADYDDSKGRRLLGASAATISRIDALRPYQGGNDALWRLSRLNNIEKHRVLFTVGSQAAGIALGPILARQGGDSMPAEMATLLGNLGMVLNPADKGFPLRSGFELYVDQVDAAPDPTMRFHFELALHESGVAEGRPLVKTIDEMIAAVDSVVADLAPLLV